MTNSTSRILAAGKEVLNDTHVTRMNNNDLIIGATGAGKTTGYVIPNMLRASESMIVADTKGNLYKKLSPILRENGYTIDVLDFMDPCSDSRYNPLDYIRFDKSSDKYSEQDIMTIAYSLLPDSLSKNDLFWVTSARTMLCCLISYVLEAFEPRDRSLSSVCDVFKVVQDQYNQSAQSNKQVPFLEEWSALHPDSFVTKKYKMIKGVLPADRTWGCIQQFVSTALDAFDMDNSRKLFASGGKFNIRNLGKRKSVLFLNVSDTDHSLDGIVNILYAQIFHVLCAEADSKPNGRLDVPVRVILDDFATNVNIHDFDKLISVIRSREISVSIILQSLSQLETLYNKSQSMTIVNGCDHIIYLGGNDLETAEYIASRAFRTVESILCMSNDKAYLLTRGKKGELVDKILPESAEAGAPPFDFPEFDGIDDSTLPF